MQSPTTITWTNNGLKKIKRLQDVLRIEGEVSLKKSINLFVRPKTAKLAPSWRKEAEVVSKGKIINGSKPGQTVGTPDGRRFMKAAGLLSIKEAIMTEISFTIQKSKKSALVGFGKAFRMNRKIGFAWQTREGVRTTQDAQAGPFWSREYIQAWENRARSFTIEPRDRYRTTASGRKIQARLYPEKGVWALVMQKTISDRAEGYGFFKNGLLGSTGAIKTYMKKHLVSKLREIM